MKKWKFEQSPSNCLWIVIFPN